MNLILLLSLGQLSYSTNWRDYIPMVVLIVVAPLLWFAGRRLRKLIAKQTAKRERKKLDKQPEPEPEPEYELVQLASFLNEIQAEKARSILQSNGIPSYIKRDDCGGVRPYLLVGTGGMQIVVRLPDAEKAASLLRTMIEQDCPTRQSTATD